MHTLTTKDRESLTPTYPHLQPMVMSSPVTVDPMAASKDRWQRQQRFVDRAYNRMPTVSLPPVPTVGSYRITHLTVRGETPVDHPMDAVWASARFNMRLRAMRRNPDNTVTLDPWFKRSIVIPARTTLTHKQRAAIRVMLDTIQRETITWEERQELDNHVAAITTSYGFKGLTPSPEVRVNPRGASGLVRQGASNHAKRVRGFAEMTTSRDAHVSLDAAPFILSPLNTVGVATDPNMESHEVDYLLRMIRQTPACATVRIIPNGVASWSSPVTAHEAAQGRGFIAPVSDYGFTTRTKPEAAQRIVRVIEAAPSKLDHLSDADYARVAALMESTASMQSTQADVD